MADLMASSSNIRHKIKKATNESQLAKRIIIEAPLPSHSAAVTPFLDREFSEHTKYMAQNYPEMVSHRADTVEYRVPKVVFIGELAVGKTSIIRQFCYELFSNNYTCSLGLNFEVERFRILDCIHNIQLWDTAGQERFQCITLPYYRNASIIVAVFDMSRPKTIDLALEYIKKAEPTDMLLKDVKRPTFLVGSKMDLVSPREHKIVAEKAQRCAQAIEAEYVELSCKNKQEVTHLFRRIAAVSFQNHVADIEPKRERKHNLWNQFVIRLTPNKVPADDQQLDSSVPRGTNKCCCN